MKRAKSEVKFTVELLEDNVSYNNIEIDEKKGTVRSKATYSDSDQKRNSKQPRGLDRYFDQEDDYVLYLKGDYSKSYKQARKHEKEQPPYNLIGKNCAWISIDVVSKSYPEDSLTREKLEEMLRLGNTNIPETLVPKRISKRFENAVNSLV